MYKLKDRTPKELDAAKLEAFRIIYESGRRIPTNLSYEIYRRSGIVLTEQEAAQTQDEFFDELRKTIEFRNEYDAKQVAKKPKTCLYALYALLALEIAWPLAYYYFTR